MGAAILGSGHKLADADAGSRGEERGLRGAGTLDERRRRGGRWLATEPGGQALLEAALNARPAEVHKIELEVFPDNEAAIGLYRSYGFEQEGVRRDHYRRNDGSLRSAVIMARLLREQARR
jgi:RimJ/RimL family protein N-acetyltransferase